MKKTILLILLLLVAIGAYVFVSNESKEEQVKMSTDRHFAVPREDIKKVRIIQKDNTKMTLSQGSNGKWMVNDKYPASQDAINTLLSALSRVRIQFIPPKSAYQTITEDFAKNGFKVQVFDKDSLIRSYDIGGVTQGETGTYYLMDGYTQPYVMELKGMRGSPRQRFLRNLEGWRDQGIVEYNADEIVSIKGVYPYREASNFSMQRNGVKWVVNPLDDQYTIQKELNTSTLERYLQALKRMGAESFENEYKRKKELLKTTPCFVLTIKDINDRVRKMSFYPLDTFNEDQGVKKLEADEEANIFRYMVNIEDSKYGTDLMMAQYGVIKNLFWTYPHFYFQ